MIIENSSICDSMSRKNGKVLSIAGSLSALYQGFICLSRNLRSRDNLIFYFSYFSDIAGTTRHRTKCNYTQNIFEMILKRNKFGELVFWQKSTFMSKFIVYEGIVNIYSASCWTTQVNAYTF